jgi:phosphoribosyl-AMP cyclohydrolase / phosphoribosyl-ATP pyrophosphohydrolase
VTPLPAAARNGVRALPAQPMKNPKIDWKKNAGLVPVIVQDTATLQVLMLGYMNAAALKQTIATRRVTFFSRSKQRLWTKGESSKNFLHLVSLKVDCDHDTLLVTARPDGPTCHRGTPSCFGDGGATGAGFLAQLDQVVAARLKGGDKTSYTVRLAREGVARVAQKVGEEGVETALAALSSSDKAFSGEAADLLYHLIVLLRVKKLSLADAIAVLEKRHAPKK